MKSITKTFLKPVTFILIAAASVFAQSAPPVVSQVRDLAAQIPQGFPFYALVPGGFILINGTDMGPAETVIDYPAFPLPLSLAGTSIEATVDGVTVQALMTSTSDDRVTAVLPSETPIGNGTLTLTYNGQTSAAFDIVVANTVGLFTQNGRGEGPVLAFDSNFFPITTLSPTHPGDMIGIVASAHAIPTQSAGLLANGEAGLDNLQKLMQTRDAKAFANAPRSTAIGSVASVGGLDTPVLGHYSLGPGLVLAIIRVPNVTGCWTGVQILGDSANNSWASLTGQLSIASLPDTVCRSPYGDSYESRLSQRTRFLESGVLPGSKHAPKLTRLTFLVGHVQPVMASGQPVSAPAQTYDFRLQTTNISKFTHEPGFSEQTLIEYSKIRPFTFRKGIDIKNPIVSGPAGSVPLSPGEFPGLFGFSQGSLGPELNKLSFSLDGQSQSGALNLGAPSPSFTPTFSINGGFSINPEVGFHVEISNPLTLGYHYRTEFKVCQLEYCTRMIKLSKSSPISFTPWEASHLPPTNNGEFVVSIETDRSGTFDGNSIFEFPLTHDIYPGYVAIGNDLHVKSFVGINMPFQ